MVFLAETRLRKQVVVEIVTALDKERIQKNYNKSFASFPCIAIDGELTCAKDVVEFLANKHGIKRSVLLTLNAFDTEYNRMSSKVTGLRSQLASERSSGRRNSLKEVGGDNKLQPLFPEDHQLEDLQQELQHLQQELWKEQEKQKVEQKKRGALERGQAFEVMQMKASLKEAREELEEARIKLSVTSNGASSKRGSVCVSDMDVRPVPKALGSKLSQALSIAAEMKQTLQSIGLGGEEKHPSADLEQDVDYKLDVNDGSDEVDVSMKRFSLQTPIRIDDDLEGTMDALHYQFG